MKQSVKSNLMTLIAVAALPFLFALAPHAHAAPSAAPAKWTDLARKVGSSEEGRDAALKELKAIPNLKAKLKKAIYTNERPLALDVISSLSLEELVPDLLLHVAADPDGFLTVAVNAMMHEKNQTLILKSYLESLEPRNLSRVSNGAVVAMLEPIGRMGVKLPRATLDGLKNHESPEVRGSTLYYLRIMSVRNRSFENLDIVTDLTKATEFQLRLQALAMTSEIHALNQAPKPKGLLDKDEVKARCNQEKQKQIKTACLSFVDSASGVSK